MSPIFFYIYVCIENLLKCQLSYEIIQILIKVSAKLLSSSTMNKEKTIIKRRQISQLLFKVIRKYVNKITDDNFAARND